MSESVNWCWYAEYATCGCSFIAQREEMIPKTCPDHTHPRSKLKTEPESLFAGLDWGHAGGYCECNECVAAGRQRGASQPAGEL